VTYKYNGDNKRVSKSSGKTYWYAGGGTPIAETDASGNTTDEYIYLGGLRVARRDSAGNVVYYMADHIETSRIVTDSLGNVLDQSDFYPFGGERVISASSGNTYKFTGKERDSESDLDNFEARYMASTQGRFMSPDPSGMSSADLSNPQSLNLYTYVLNSPLMFTDPTGLDPCDEDNDDPTCEPGTGNGLGYGTFPQPVMDANIPILPKGMGDDCETNPTLNGCPGGPDLGPPPTGCLTVFCGPIHPDLIPPPREAVPPPGQVSIHTYGIIHRLIR
jgi:RHS repeat-associated protein